VINSSRSERGWQGRRRIAVLVSIAGVLGIAALGSASTASAASVANCNAKLEPKGNSTTSAKLSFVCDGEIRAYTVASTGKIKNYSPSSASLLTCEGTGVGFGCGVSDRAAPGTQAPGTTGWNTTTPGASTSSTALPTTCHGFTRIEGAGTSTPTFPNRNGIVTGPCSQVIAPGTKVTQSIKLGTSACSPNTKLFLLVGGEPNVTAFLAPNSAGGGGDNTTVGENISQPIKVSMKAYKSCATPIAKAKKTAAKSSAPATKFPVTCSGSVSQNPTRSNDSDVTFICSQNIRAFAIYSNKQIDLPGDEPLVSGPSGGKENEGALHQCEGDFPGYGYGCGIVDRQTVTASTATNANLPNGQGISAGNTVKQTMGFDSSPCQKAGQQKTKVWLVAMGEPTIGSTVGEFTSAPQSLVVNYGKCKGGKKKK
jgi:hypothetical protein